MKSFTLERSNATELYRDLIATVLRNGSHSSPRGLGTTECLGVTLILNDANDNIIDNPVRKLNYSFSIAEWLWIMTGSSLAETILPFNNNLSIALGDPAEHSFQGAYGPKWIEQLDYVIKTLRDDPYSRQAVVNIWRDRPRQTADTPCTLNWQFFIREERLHMHTHMRSNDVWLGTPYDIFTFTQIQRWLAGQLNVTAGSYTHFAGSMHIYDKNIDAATEAMRSGSALASAAQGPMRASFTPHLSTLQHVLLECSRVIANERNYNVQPLSASVKSGLRAVEAQRIEKLLSRYNTSWKALPYIMLSVPMDYAEDSPLAELSKRQFEQRYGK